MHSIYWVDGWLTEADEPAGGGVKLADGLSLEVAKRQARAMEGWARETYGGVLSPGLCVVLDSQGKRVDRPRTSGSLLTWLAGLLTRGRRVPAQV